MRTNFKKLNSKYIKVEINNLLNTILNNFISKSKINKFSKLIQEYGFNPSDFTYITEEKEFNRHKIPEEELKKRIKEKPKKKVQIDEDDIDLDLDLTIEKCDHYEKKIRKHELAGKKYYYYFGLNLSRLKCLMIIQGYFLKDINIFIEERYHIKLSTINKYIRFNEICNKYLSLLNCGLVYTEIMQNIPEIEKLLS